MKLVIYDENWRLYRPLLERYLGASWSISAGAGTLAWLLEEVQEADALLALKLPPEALALAHRLRVFLYPGAGVMQKDSGALPEGCSLCNVYEHEVPISEYVLMVILMHATQILRHSSNFRHGNWDGNGRCGGEVHEEVNGKTLGLVGFGRIAQAVAIRAQAFGLCVEAIRRDPQAPLSPQWASIVHSVYGPDRICDLFSRSDFIVIACDLNEETKEWIGWRELSHIRPQSLLVNVSRAEIIQEEPLFRVLEQRRFSAALDVWYRYPKTSRERLEGSRFPLQQLPNVLPTPHFSAWTGSMLERRMKRIAENLERLSRGEPLERVVTVGTWKPSVA
ncbi:MAG TPA: NAD(P)-dependent oxidoreductase [Candidatus Acidoferrales bacterium]|nr:NAD(P)-dependent oxidoreductase [Candidatus Acidoferrales bacterium]